MMDTYASKPKIITIKSIVTIQLNVSNNPIIVIVFLKSDYKNCAMVYLYELSPCS